MGALTSQRFRSLTEFQLRATVLTDLSVRPRTAGLRSTSPGRVRPREPCARLSVLYTTSFREATFPTPWKEANLVLLDKPGRDPTTPSAYRLICLLNVEGKLFERVIASRIDEHLRSGRGRNDLSPNQYGFRAGRSTTDALNRVCAGIRDTLRRGSVAIAVLVDIKNAFNSVPWSAIRDGLTSKSVPDYLASIIDLGEEDRVRETGQNDGKGGPVLRRATGIGSRTTTVQHRLRPHPHPDRSSRRRIVDLLQTTLVAGGRRFANARKRDFTRRRRPSGASDSGCLCRKSERQRDVRTPDAEPARNAG